MKPLVYKKAKRRAPRRRRVRMRLHVTKGDTVRVIRATTRASEGKVLRVYPEDRAGDGRGREHREAAPAARRADEQSGIIELPAPIHHSKVMLLDPEERASRRASAAGMDEDGTVERIAVKSGQPIPRSR